MIYEYIYTANMTIDLDSPKNQAKICATFFDFLCYYNILFFCFVLFCFHLAFDFATKIS